MKAHIQRVTMAAVHVDGHLISEIEHGMLILFGVGHEDDTADIDYLVKKIPALRIFEDGNGKMNLSVGDITGQILIVPQFTLYASTKKGNRPSFIGAADSEKGEQLFNSFLTKMQQVLPGRVFGGKFGADMQVSLVNNGPVTILIDTEENRLPSRGCGT